MMSMRTIFFLAVTLSLFACERSRDQFEVVKAVPLYPRGNILHFYNGMDRTADTVFQVEAGKAVVLRSDRGVLLEIPAQAFVSPGGEWINGPVRIHWKEVRSIYEQIARQISHRVGSAWLDSRVLFDIRAEQQGQDLILAKPLTIRWPDVQAESGLQLFQGMTPTPYSFDWMTAPEGSVHSGQWTDPTQGEATSGYVMVVATVGCLSAGRAVSVPDSEGFEVEARFFPAYNQTNTAVYFIDMEGRRGIALQDLGEGRFKLPVRVKGQTGRLFSVTEALKYNYYSEWVDLPVLTAPLTWEPRPGAQTPWAIHDMLRQL